MNPETTLPIFLKIPDKPCLVVGGGKVAWRKAQWLLDCGARVEVLAPDFCREIRDLETSHPARMLLIPGAYTPRKLDAFALVIAATSNQEANAQVRADARASGLLVNVVDQPELCDFFVPATVVRGGLKLAVGSGGGCPPLAAAIRGELEQAYPPWYEAFAVALARVRQRLKHEDLDMETRKKILSRLSSREVAVSVKDKNPDAMEAALLTMAGGLASALNEEVKK